MADQPESEVQILSPSGVADDPDKDGTVLSTDSILQSLVTEDLSSIRNPEALHAFFIEHINNLPPKVISEILSVLIAIVKKSVFHLESARGLLIPCINYLLSESSEWKTIETSKSDEPGSGSSISLTKHFLREWVQLLIAHSCNVEELKSILKLSEVDPSLLTFIQQANLKQRVRPHAFFAFPGTRGSMISLPPLQKWPTQNGWSFSTWFLLEPKACDQPYLYNFKTGKSGLGYSAHFTGNCLVLTSIRVKGKGVQHCVAYEFPSYKWIHCAITYHNKWRVSEIKVYVNGQLSANIEMAWQVQTTEMFDKCFIGGSGSITTADRSGELNCFCGQMSAICLFNEGLSPAHICSLHRLGPSYMGQFKYSNESYVNLPPQICKTLYDEKLATSLFCLFTPVAVDSGTLCIQCAPFRSSTSANAQNYFISAPHAALLGTTKAIITQPICSTLQSLGCSRSFLPLLDAFANKSDPEACASLIGFICDLLESSPHWFANEIVQNNGFVVVACALASQSRLLLSDRLLDILLNLARSLLTTSTTHGDSLLLKHFMDNLLFNPTLWIYAETNIQLKLYTYLGSEFLHGTRHGANKYTMSNSNNSSSYIPYNPTTNAASVITSNQNYPANGQATNDDQTKGSYYESQSPIVTDLLFGEVRRVSTVLQSLHALKYYYWMVQEDNINQRARNTKLRPNRDDMKLIRSHILLFAKELISKANSIPFDETQGILNYLSSCTQPENLLDVIEVLSSLIKEHPTSMVSALDQKQAVKVIFNLIGSKSEAVRVRALKLLSLFMSHCSLKKKQDIMGPNNLFMLLFDKLRVSGPLSTETYDALMRILVESDGSETLDYSKMKIENSMIIKVIASLIHDQRIHNSRFGVTSQNEDCDAIRKSFINDLWNLIVNSRENRRIILQMSVWQHSLINLIDSTVNDSQLIRDQILAIFRVLLYHAIRYEYGGWRVWIDTLAIIHTKVSYDEFKEHLNSEQVNFAKSIESTKNETNIPQNPESKTPDIQESNNDEKTVHISGESSNLDESELADVTETISNKQTFVSSISERIPNKSTGIQMVEEGVDEIDSEVNKSTEVSNDTVNDVIEDKNETDDQSHQTPSQVVDTPDLAPSREFRKISLDNSPDIIGQPTETVSQNLDLTRDQSLTSISLDESTTREPGSGEEVIEVEANPSPESDLNQVNVKTPIEPDESESKLKTPPAEVSSHDQVSSKTPSASPAFRIPEFKWGTLLIKLLNDLMFSIECDLYHWKCLANVTSTDASLFTPKTANSQVNPNSNPTNSSSNRDACAILSKLEAILQKPENQIYIVNVIHFVHQLADNIIIASGGLLPLLADATGGTRGSSEDAPKSQTCEGLTLSQANSLLYRLVYIIDMVIFSAPHINLSELEADKNTTSGGILRQCLRLACTTTVKNCLVLRSIYKKISAMGIDGGCDITEADFPKDMFDSYHGCSLLSANGLFENSALTLEETDLMADIEYSPHQMPNASSRPSILPFQSNPIKDPNKLLQNIDINRLQECIYHDSSTESKQSQFLALSSLYFISVLMVSKYRDIIEPKQVKKSKHTTSTSPTNVSDSVQSSTEAKKKVEAVSSIEANLLNFGKMQPNSQPSGSGSNALTNMLTTRLENTLDTVCPLLKSIMCDFSAFLSKTLVGSHGQDLVNKEAERTFKRTNTSPVELVMLLCSQEWQNTLQKNAGLAFIELINEGRVLSHGMKDHIVRVAMEAEFILSRLRADDVVKHEHFGLVCSESLAARLHEEALINSLISSASRRDFIHYSKFKESLLSQRRKNYKIDIWEDDDRRKRRFVFDSWSDSHQKFYTKQLTDDTSKTTNKSESEINQEMQTPQALSEIHDHCLSVTMNATQSDVEHHLSKIEKDDDLEDEEYDDDEARNNDSSPDTDPETSRMASCGSKKDQNFMEYNERHTNDKNYHSQGTGKAHKHSSDITDNRSDSKSNQNWDYDDCSSVNDFTSSVIFEAECSYIWGIYAINGVFQITGHEVYFEPNQNISEAIEALKTDQDGVEASGRFAKIKNNESTTSEDKNNLRKVDFNALKYCDFLVSNGKISLNDIRAIFSRHYLLQPHALEIFISQRSSVMFAFQDFDSVKRAVKHMPPVGVGIKYGIPQTRRASLMTPRQLFAASNMTQKWRKREIGNFQYLMFLNTIAGRTYQDLNQYPVFPWILTNYESEQLDLNEPTNFRDLSKPIGALNSKRREEFIERYESWDNSKVPAFHYGTHYSTAAFTLNWLCRLRGSYNSCYLALQDDKYEEDSRLFLSIGDSWVSSLIGGQQNVKELIPEFFYLPEMFCSNLGLPEVEFPPWAKSPQEFVRMHRIALESELVSCQLHQWIDLIFGYKQRGPEAVSAVNTFYYLTYQGNVNLNMIQDPELRDAIETQIKHFGQTPSQLTTEPHPPRFSALHASPMVFSSSLDELNKVVKFPFNTPVVHISSCISDYIASTNSMPDSISTGTVRTSNIANSPSSVVTITSNNQYQIHKWLSQEESNHPLTIDSQLEQTNAPRRQLIDVDDFCTSVPLKVQTTIGDDNVVEEIQWPSTHYIVTLNGHYIIMGSFYDNSFRVFTTESGKLCQVIYGHRGPITCIARSEGNASADFYIATGSADCSLSIWTWNERYAQVEGSGVSAVHNPLPKLSITGHQSPVLSALICAELGLVVSGSKNLILVHTTSNGENIIEIDVILSNLIEKMVNDNQKIQQGDSITQRPQVEDKQRTLLEASMLGDQKTPNSKTTHKTANSETSSQISQTNHKFAHLKDLCKSDYFITNLQLSRELAFIICVAVPPPRKKSRRTDDTNASSSAALLVTFNLKGSLMDCTTIGNSINSPRLGDPCALLSTRDGEYLILNDSPTSIKIYRTFDLQPMYAYNTNDIPNSLSEDQNRVRSMALLDHMYILVGLENGKIIVYNADFKNFP